MMQAQEELLLEKREPSSEYSVWWNKLSLAQKFSASSLGKFGYELSFVRNDKGHSLAVLIGASGVAIITEEGDINTSPNITIRD